MKKRYAVIVWVIFSAIVMSCSGYIGNVPDYVNSYTWNEISRGEAEKIWNGYVLTKKFANAADVYDIVDGKVRMFPNCQIFRDERGVYYVNPIMRLSVSLTEAPNFSYDTKYYVARNNPGLVRCTEFNGSRPLTDSVYSKGWLVDFIAYSHGDRNISEETVIDYH